MKLKNKKFAWLPTSVINNEGEDISIWLETYYSYGVFDYLSPV